MKLRSKLLLSATCLLTISVAATATSAYAWFVSNRQATVAINNANVKTNATNLKIAGVGKDAANGDTAELTTGPGANEVSATTTIKATDISGDGVKFFKPRLAPDFGVEKVVGEEKVTTYNATSIDEVSNSETSTYYHQFKLTFSQDNANVNMGVFLGSESRVLLNTGATPTGLSLCTRVAFLDSKGALLRYWAPNRTSVNANQSYIDSGYNEGATVSIEDGDAKSSVLQSVSGTGSTIKDKLIYGNPDPVNDVTDGKASKKEYLLTLVGKTPQTITVRIWFEGMDSDCDSNYLGQTIDANLKFNGVNMDI